MRLLAHIIDWLFWASIAAELLLLIRLFHLRIADRNRWFAFWLFFQASTSVILARVHHQSGRYSELWTPITLVRRPAGLHYRLGDILPPRCVLWRCESAGERVAPVGTHHGSSGFAIFRFGRMETSQLEQCAAHSFDIRSDSRHGPRSLHDPGRRRISFISGEARELERHSDFHDFDWVLCWDFGRFPDR